MATNHKRMSYGSRGARQTGWGRGGGVRERTCLFCCLPHSIGHNRERGGDRGHQSAYHAQERLRVLRGTEYSGQRVLGSLLLSLALSFWQKASLMLSLSPPLHTTTTTTSRLLCYFGGFSARRPLFTVSKRIVSTLSAVCSLTTGGTQISVRPSNIAAHLNQLNELSAPACTFWHATHEDKTTTTTATGGPARARLCPAPIWLTCR